MQATTVFGRRTQLNGSRYHVIKNKKPCNKYYLSANKD